MLEGHHRGAEHPHVDLAVRGGIGEELRARERLRRPSGVGRRTGLGTDPAAARAPEHVDRLVSVGASDLESLRVASLDGH